MIMIKSKAKKLSCFLLALAIAMSLFPAMNARGADGTKVTFYFKTTSGSTLSNARLDVQIYSWLFGYYDYYNNIKDGGSKSLDNGSTWRLVAGDVSNYEFAYWSASGGISFDSGSTTSQTSPSLNLNGASSGTVTAYYRPKYTLTVNQTTGGTVTPGSGSYGEGTTITFSAEPSSGYDMGTWSGVDSYNGASATVTMNSNRTVSATFVRLYTLATSAGTGGAVTEGGTYKRGTTVTVSAQPNNGYVFSKWQYLSGSLWLDYGTQTNPLSVTLTSNLSLKALFSVAPVQLSYSGAAFYEAGANDGSIGNTITATSDSIDFKGSISSGDYTVTGTLPSGLTLSVARNPSNFKQAVISLSGKAAYHKASNSADGIKITFNASAFSVAVPSVTNKDLTFSIQFNDPLSVTADGSTFCESDMNDGSVAGTRALLLTGSAAFADAEFSEGTHYSISGVPSGLTAVVKRESGSRLQLYFKGAASSHTGTASVTLKLNAAAFTGGSSAGIAGLTQTFTIAFYNDKPIRVLEIYPNAILSTETERKTDAYTYLTQADPRYIVTTMSLNEFISKTDDVNGNYDAVYFGFGRYALAGVSSIKYGNDLTSLAAGKVLEFINAGQACIFSGDALKRDSLDSSDTIIKTQLGAYATDSNKITSASQLKAKLDAVYASSNKRPVLDMIAYPYSYRDNDTPYDSNLLTFTYRASDPDGAEDKKLTATLYIDKNNDSKFDGPNEAVATHTVSNGKYDTFTYSMPDGLTGVFFWKLALEDEAKAQDEFGGVFRLKGEELEINVLQVCPTGNELDLASALNTAVPGTSDTLGCRKGEYKINISKVSIGEFNNPSVGDPYKMYNLNGTYDMIVFGFDDEYSLNDLDSDSVARLESFIATGQSVMFTHDTIEWSGYRSSNLLTYLRDDVGQTTAETATQIVRQYANGSTIASNYGLSTSGYDKLRPNVTDASGATGTTHVRLVNSTPLSLYPFNLEGIAPADTSVANTHYQYYKLDLENPKMIPVYNYYRNDVAGRVLDDAMNSYYTYSFGTVTYSGTGHSAVSPSANFFELKLFANTMLKAYTGANHAPSIEVYYPQNNAILDNSQPGFDLSFKGSDFDFGDDTLNYAVYISTDGGKTYKTVETGAMNSGATKTISGISKADYGIGSEAQFKAKIEVWDNASAKAVSELNLSNSTLPKLTPSISVSPSNFVYLVGDTISFDIGVSASGKGETTIVPSLTLEIPAGLAGGSALYYNYNDFTFVFTSSGPATPSHLYDTKQITLANAGSYNVSAKCEYPSGSGSVSQTASAGLTVRSGKVSVAVKDDKGNAMENVSVTKVRNGVSAVLKTGPGGSCAFANVERGENTFAFSAPDGYKLKSVTAVSKSGMSVSGAGDGTINIPLSGEDCDWDISCEFEPDSGSVSVIIRDSQGNPLKDVAISQNGSSSSSGLSGTDGKYVFAKVPIGSNTFAFSVPSGYELSKITAAPKGGEPVVSTAGSAIGISIGGGKNEWSIDCQFRLAIQPQIVYYKLEPNGTLTALKKDSNGEYSLEAAKDRAANVVAIFKLPKIEGSDVGTLNLSLSLDGSSGISILSAEPSGAVKDWSATAEGAKPLFITASNTVPSGSFAKDDTWYYTVIEASNSSVGKFAIGSIYLKMGNGSEYTFDSGSGGMIKVREYIPPVLR